ncbi:MAG: hypothetical protein ACI4SC_03040, partial [Candidatus Neoclostridium sp.]
DDTITVSDDNWGSKEYPYVISDVRHLYNLSELQRLGYFYKSYIGKNEAGSYSKIPYFLVCTPDYTPALIDGTNFRGCSSIGTNEYPFIGSVRGVCDEQSSVTVGGKTCDTSVIYNVKVNGHPANTDVGLFGYVGYLGDSSAADEQTGAFAGQNSTLSNLVLVDVQVSVAMPDGFDGIVEFLEDIMIDKTGGHRYSYSELYSEENPENYNGVPHENRHIGILAGHVSYATVEYVSVYYSSDDVVAIDLRDSSHSQDGTEKANYLSAMGILGFLHNVNPTVTTDESGNTFVTEGSGSSGITYGQSGGGGLASGIKSGYVLASNIYNNYHRLPVVDENGNPIYDENGNPVYKDDTSGTVKLIDALDEDGKPLCTEWIRDRILWGTQNTGKYYFYDGVFTFALSSQDDVLETTWTEEDPGEFAIGSTNPDDWKVNYSKGNTSVVAFVKEIDTEEKFNTVVESNQPIYIGYEQGETVYLMSLTESDDASSSGFFDNFADNKYKTIAFNRNFMTDKETVASIQETLKGLYKDNPDDPKLPYDKDGYVNTDILDNIGDYRLINLGTAADITELKNKYTINVSTASNGKYYIKSGDNFLSLLCQRTRITRTYTYSIWAGASKPSDGWFAYFWSNMASVEFSGGTFRIRYNLTAESQAEELRYASFNGDVTTPKFQGTEDDTTDFINLKFYTVEGTSDLNFGRVTFDPKDGTGGQSFKVSDYVLFAAPTHTLDANGYIASTTTTYEVAELAALGIPDGNTDTGVIGWQDGKGNHITKESLQKKFRMYQGINFGANINIINGTLATDGMLTAPVGTNGVEANIPQGCIAFRVNKASDNIKIRVIVSTAVSELYPGESEDYDLGSYTRFFNLWKMEEAGESAVQVFEATGSGLLDRFIVPRSHPYEPGKNAASSDSEYINVRYNEADYRCYLNGDRVLVAYEFSVDSTSNGTGTGIYCLGMSGMNGDGGMVKNVPMEIIYFSADGVASAGRDGENASQIGTIDFVYDYNGVIVTVKDGSVTDKDGNEDYSGYYPSYCILYSDIAKPDANYTEANPSYLLVNNEKIVVRRYVDTGESPPVSDENHNTTISRSVIIVKLGGDKNVCIVQYSRYADNVKVEDITT